VLDDYAARGTAILEVYVNIHTLLVSFVAVQDLENLLVSEMGEHLVDCVKLAYSDS
jgi:hypothetical protein